VDSKAECGRLNMAHETKAKCQCPLCSVYRFKIREGSPEGIRRLWRKGIDQNCSPDNGTFIIHQTQMLDFVVWYFSFL